MDKIDLTKIGFIEKEDKYKLIIPEKVEKQIREWCILSPTTEWSGTLFYKTEGSFKDKNIVFIAEDFLVSDIGSSGFTQFDVTPEICNYMLENELMDCYTALIHSHNTMSAFFSGTDNTTLKEEGYDTCHFLSLVVNNAGNYVARVTRKVIEQFVGKKVISYPTFENENISIEEDCHIENHEIIEYYNLNIEIQGINNSIKDKIKARFDELKKKNEEIKALQPKFPANTGFNNPIWNTNNFKLETKKEEKKNPIQLNLFNEKEDTKNHDDNYLGIDHIDAVEMAAQILYGNITLSYDNFQKFTKVSSWIRSGMIETLDKRFHASKDSRANAVEAYDDFLYTFIDTIVNDYLENNYDYYSSLYPELTDEFDFKYMITDSIFNEIEKLEKDALKEGTFHNPYLESIKSNLTNNIDYYDYSK